VPEHIAAGAVRFSLGRGTTLEEIDEVIARITSILG
jgi:cysteine sulfinate desulfinase/cysteine desulfurase-like protein